MKLLRERVSPKRYKQQKIVKRDASALTYGMVDIISKQLFQRIPPLKDFPDEHESESDTKSEKIDVVIEIDRIEKETADLKKQWP